MDRSELPLIGSPEVRKFLDAKQQVTGHSLSAVDYVRQQADLTIQDCVGICLQDQADRWKNGKGLPVETYLQALNERLPSVPEKFTWELVAHEIALRQAWKEFGEPPQMSEFVERFPALKERLTTEMSDSLPPVEANSTVVFKKDDDLTGSGDETCCKQTCEFEATIIEFEDESSHRMLDSGYAQPQQSLLGRERPFSLLPPQLVAKIESRLDAVTFQPGEYLMRQGDPGSGLFVIEEGRVEILMTDRAGERHLLAMSTVGEILGEMSLLTEEPRTADVVAVDCVRARFLPAAVFDELASDFPVISRVLTQLFADRLGQKGRDALAGKMLSHYRVSNRLGKGGMAIVYAAEDQRTGEQVALKMMSHRLVFDAQALKMFQREARLIESFNHPNIVRMLGRFQAFRTFFIAMEFCSGTSLEDIVRVKGPFEQQDLKRVLGQLASAIDYAHGMQVVHRDIKPSNVMRTDDGTTKLMDFGLANPIDDVPGGKQAIVGTPLYMAPEQMRGENVDARADYFALGCLAYKLLTGTNVFHQTSINALRAAHAKWTPPELTGIDPELRHFIRTCLQRSPANRDVDMKAAAKWAE